MLSQTDKFNNWWCCTLFAQFRRNRNDGCSSRRRPRCPDRRKSFAVHVAFLLDLKSSGLHALDVLVIAAVVTVSESECLKDLCKDCMLTEWGDIIIPLHNDLVEFTFIILEEADLRSCGCLLSCLTVMSSGMSCSKYLVMIEFCSWDWGGQFECYLGGLVIMVPNGRTALDLGWSIIYWIEIAELILSYFCRQDIDTREGNSHIIWSCSTADD